MCGDEFKECCDRWIGQEEVEAFKQLKCLNAIWIVVWPGM
jgi:hypothetical protein